MDLTEIAENVYEIERRGEMRIPVRVYASDPLLEEMLEEGDLTLEQASNVATLPGIQKFSVLLPDGHQGYGFPIGGVAAVDLDEGVISPAESASTSTVACECCVRTSRTKTSRDARRNSATSSTD